MGIICAQSDFSFPQTGLLNNGYVHLGIVALLMCVLLWAVTWLKAKMVRRVQLCILFSVLVHLGLAIYLHGQYLALISNEGIEETKRRRAAIDDPRPCSAQSAAATATPLAGVGG